MPDLWQLGDCFLSRKSIASQLAHTHIYPYELSNRWWIAHTILHRSPHGKGSGTLTRLPILGDGKALLLTCHHVIPDKQTAAGCLVSIDRYNDDYEESGTTFSGEKLFDLSTFKTDTTNVSTTQYMYHKVKQMFEICTTVMASMICCLRIVH